MAALEKQGDPVVLVVPRLADGTTGDFGSHVPRSLAKQWFLKQIRNLMVDKEDDDDDNVFGIGGGERCKRKVLE